MPQAIRSFCLKDILTIRYERRSRDERRDVQKNDDGGAWRQLQLPLYYQEKGPPARPTLTPDLRREIEALKASQEEIRDSLAKIGSHLEPPEEPPSNFPTVKE